MSGGAGEHTPGPDGWHMREVAHYNGGKEWFGYRHQCIERPRLSRMDRYLRKDRSVQSTWRVDGADVASFSEAVEALETPPVITIAEMKAVSQFASGTCAKRDFANFADIAADLRSMSDKGLVWWENGRVRLLPGALMEALDTAESNASGNLEWEFVSARINAARATIAKARGES